MTRLHTLLQSSAASWIFAISWSVLLITLLLQPEADPVIDLGLPKGQNTLARELAFSALHVVAFSTTTVIWFLAFSAGSSFRASLIRAVIIAVVLGCATEFLQSYTLDRHASLIDLIANLGGTLLAAFLIWRRKQ